MGVDDGEKGTEVGREEREMLREEGGKHQELGVGRGRGGLFEPNKTINKHDRDVEGKHVLSCRFYYKQKHK